MSVMDRLAAPTPMESWNELARLRTLLSGMRDVRLRPDTTPEHRAYIEGWYNPKLEAIDAGMAALAQLHRLEA